MNVTTCNCKDKSNLAFRVQLGANQGVTGGGYTKVNYDTIIYDETMWYSDVAYRLQPTRPCRMIVFASMKGQQNLGYGTSLLIVKNDISNVVASNSYSGAAPVISMSAFIDFDGENDFIEAYLSTSTGTYTTVFAGANTQISGVVV